MSKSNADSVRVIPSSRTPLDIKASTFTSSGRATLIEAIINKSTADIARFYLIEMFTLHESTSESSNFDLLETPEINLVLETMKINLFTTVWLMISYFSLILTSPNFHIMCNTKPFVRIAVSKTAHLINEVMAHILHRRDFLVPLSSV